MGDSDSFNDLLCTENETSLIDEQVLDDVGSLDTKNLSVPDDENEFVKILLDQELSFGFNKNDATLVQDNGIRFARTDAIDWVLKSRDIFGFQLQTAYLCMAYFDRFLSRRSIDSGKLWAIRLLSVACLSLAAKMDESKVPALSKFQMDDIEFESKVIRRMELLVMKTLEWKMAVITPFPYLPYFITTLCSSSLTSGLSFKTSQLILAIMKDVNLISYRPSVIAAAATMMALEQRLTRNELESRMKDTFCYGYLDIEDIYTCYNIMQNLEMRRGLEASNSANSPPMSPRQFRPAIDSMENSFSHKRKRLTFDDNDRNDDPPAC